MSANPMARELGDPAPGEAAPSIVRGPIYIGGLDRSGKTTMRAFLTSHPNVAIPAVGSNMETYFFGRFGDLADTRNLDRCLDAMLRYKHVAFLKPDGERIRREFGRGPHTYERLFSLFLIDYAERQGKPRWGAQTGLIERYADALFEAFPDARVVHMVRDPRDRYEASLALWPDGRGRAGGATARWRYSLRLAERNLRRYPNGYLIVRFEDQVIRTEETVRAVCDFIGERFDPQMLAMPGAPEHRAKLLGGSGDGSGSGLLSGRFIGRFQRRVPRRELAFMQLHAGRLMARYGYATERLGLSPTEWARFAVVDWPNQATRMVAWQTVETLQQRFPTIVARKPGSGMILDSGEGGP